MQKIYILYKNFSDTSVCIEILSQNKILYSQNKLFEKKFVSKQHFIKIGPKDLFFETFQEFKKTFVPNIKNKNN